MKHYLWQFTIMASLALFILFSTEKSSAQKSNAKILLSWEVPEEGTAVNFNSVEEYLSDEPVLHSTGRGDQTMKIQLDMSAEIARPPELQRVILPGTESRPEENYNSENNEEYMDNKLGKKAAEKAKEFYENKIKTVRVNGTLLNIEADCSFFVRAAYWEASDHTRDLFKESIATKSIDPRKATGVTLLGMKSK